MAKKALLMILDGWRIGNEGKGDVTNNTPTPYLDCLSATYLHSQLQVSGENVGLPDGQMGSSEVGYLNIGTGRVVYQDLVKINRTCRDGSIPQNPEVVSACTYAQKTGKELYLTGLINSDGVHSFLDRLYQLLIISKKYGLKNIYAHCFMNGRDTDPKSGVGFIEALQYVCGTNDAHIVSIIGRFYAVDRNKRRSRVKEACDLLVSGVGEKMTNVVQTVYGSYAGGVTDEFVEPIINAAVQGQIEEGDVVTFFNFHNNRARGLTQVLTQTDMPDEGIHTIKDSQCYTMMLYDANFGDVHVLFPKENVEMTLGEYLSSLGKKQLHTAETERYTHVTFFFDGGREEPYKGEGRVLVNSPKVATYDLRLEMSAYGVKDKLVDAIDTQQYDFVVVNPANGGMVGHTGVYNVIAKVVWAIGHCMKEVIEAAKADDYEAIVIANHGNADNAINEDGTPSMARSLNPVPFIYVTNNDSATMKDGRLANAAPSVLHTMGLEQPEAMTGKNLIVD